MLAVPTNWGPRPQTEMRKAVLRCSQKYDQTTSTIFSLGQYYCRRCIEATKGQIRRDSSILVPGSFALKVNVIYQ